MAIPRFESKRGRKTADRTAAFGKGGRTAARHIAAAHHHVGLVLAYALNYLLVTHTQSVKLDWRLIVFGIALLWLQTILATLAPAFRAASVPPVIATRAV